LVLAIRRCTIASEVGQRDDRGEVGSPQPVSVCRLKLRLEPLDLGNKAPLRTL
jgi:hypothetical protein